MSTQGTRVYALIQRMTITYDKEVIKTIYPINASDKNLLTVILLFSKIQLDSSPSFTNPTLNEKQFKVGSSFLSHSL